MPARPAVISARKSSPLYLTGDVGKGFAVVANEVKDLAETSKREAAKIKPYSLEIKMVFGAIREKTESASRNFANTADLVMKVTKSTEEMSKTTSEINLEAQKLINNG